MKRSILLTALMSLLIFTSCDLGDDTVVPGSYPNNAAYLTTYLIESDEEDAEKKYYFLSDNGTKLFLTDNQSTATLRDKERMIGYFALIEDYSAEGSEELEGATYGCSYGLRLFSVDEVRASQSAVVTTQEESDAIADHAISYIYDSIGYGYNFINLSAAVRADKIDNVNYYLVQNLSATPEVEEDGYLNLELRYDRDGDEAVGSTYGQYISLNIEEFASQLEGMDGIILRALTLNSGTIHIKIDIDETDTEQAKVVTKTDAIKF